MSFTNFPNGVSSFGIPMVGGAPFGPNSQAWFVAPRTGSDGNSGKSSGRPVKTLSKALSLAVADRNDVVFMIAEDNSASGTTDYQSTALDWNKDGVHLIGVNSGTFMGQRSRIAQLSTATDVDGLFTLSASNCYISNIHIFQGVDDSGSVNAMTVTGERNLIENCHIAGIGHNTMDVAANRSLMLDGAAETVFRNCTIGLDTISRDTATAEIEFTNQVTRLLFDRCVFPTFAGAAGFVFLDFDAASTLDRFTVFRDCLFTNAVQSTATEMTELTDANASAGGALIFQNVCVMGVGSGQIDAGSTGTCYNNAPTTDTNGDGGFAQPVD